MTTTTFSQASGASVASGTDTYLVETDPTGNYDGLTTFQVYSWASGDRGHGILSFTGLTTIPAGSTLSAASVVLSPTSGVNGHVIEQYECLRAVVEAQATWNIWSTGNNWASAGCLGSGTDRSAVALASQIIAPGTLTLIGAGLLSLLQAKINASIDVVHFMFMRNPDTAFDATADTFTSCEGTNADRPLLSITWTAGASDTLMGAACY